MIGFLIRVEYDALRLKFVIWAHGQGMSCGSDEGGRHDDDPAAARIWKTWLADAILISDTEKLKLGGDQ